MKSALKHAAKRGRIHKIANPRSAFWMLCLVLIVYVLYRHRIPTPHIRSDKNDAAIKVNVQTLTSHIGVKEASNHTNDTTENTLVTDQTETQQVHVEQTLKDQLHHVPKVHVVEADDGDDDDPGEGQPIGNRGDSSDKPKMSQEEEEEAALDEEEAVLTPENSPSDIGVRNEYQSPSTVKSALSSEIIEKLGTGQSSTPDTTFVLYRTIGNDLPPRHRLGQSHDNVKFILDNEPALPGCVRRWVVNRIAVPEEEEKILRLLDEYNQTYIHIPFSLDAYSRTQFRFHGFKHPDFLRSEEFLALPEKIQMLYMDDVFHEKNVYAMNNNGARNAALEHGIQSGIRWVLPFDGNCYFTPAAWDAVRTVVLSKGESTKYFTVPMARMQSNDDLFISDFKPNAVEEPQVIFRRDAIERFNETYRYGRRPKVELLWRLGVAGPWDTWPKVLEWERTAKDTPLSSDVPRRNLVPAAGWVARLYSGKGNLETGGIKTLINRGVSRSQGIHDMLKRLDAQVARERHNLTDETLMAFNETILALEKAAIVAGTNQHLQHQIENLRSCADYALTQGPWSVVHKTEFPPSNDKHDYYTPKPYYWPDPRKPNGMPYVRRDGQRVPGTELYDAHSEKFDRTRLAAFHGNTTCLALAWYFTGESKYADRAAVNIRTWFLDPETRMNPHIKYSQIWWGWNNNEGMNTGVIEFKDHYFFLDAVRLTHRSGALTTTELDSVKDWFRKYAKYLDESQQGQGENRAPNNHGVYYDIQRIAIAAFVNDMETAVWQANQARGRILYQFAKDGSLPEEMVRRTQLHYMMFTLSGWFTLGRLAEVVGVDLWRYKAPGMQDPALMMGAKFTIPHLSLGWRHHQSQKVDIARMWPLFYTAIERYQDMPVYREPVDLYKLKPRFHEHDGVQLFWNLGLSLSGLQPREYILRGPAAAAAANHSQQSVNLENQ
eukprot:comp23756_c0_seq1/m.41095 comp23756_c0_seq1/g.41095  ORF comp23756_c0_seq1/g.41095 comp23756_c0_seq1/m.41095 type:complete len:943 (-) comp23756_c0_seq1:611-3439(-)